jgi:hypothetical protein
MNKKTVVGILMIAMLGASAQAADQLYQPGSLIIPMDTTYQDNGMLASYGLVYSLLRNGVEVERQRERDLGREGRRGAGADVAGAGAFEGHALQRCRTPRPRQGLQVRSRFRGARG